MRYLASVHNNVTHNRLPDCIFFQIYDCMHSYLSHFKKQANMFRCNGNPTIVLCSHFACTCTQHAYLLPECFSLSLFVTSWNILWIQPKLIVLILNSVVEQYRWRRMRHIHRRVILTSVQRDGHMRSPAEWLEMVANCGSNPPSWGQKAGWRKKEKSSSQLWAEH